MKTALPLWAVLIAAVIFGYNNCGKVNFETSPELLKQQYVEFNSTSSILINGGAKYTKSQQVQLTLSSPRALEMKISNESDCSDGTWEPFADAKAWTLTKSNDTSSVYAQFKDMREQTSVCANASIVHDNVAPTAAFTTPANIFTKNANHTVQWTSHDNLSGVQSTMCSGSGVNGACDSGTLTINSTSEGSKILSVTLTDRAGNVSPGFIYIWYYDATAPTVSINSAPATRTGSGNAALTFTANDMGSGIDQMFCQIDAAAAQPCTSPTSYANLTEGAHTFQVYATDNAGNTSGKTQATWTVDMTAPTIQYTQTPPPNSNSATNVFAFTGTKNNAPISRFECHLDNGAFAICTSPHALNNVTEGTHSFEFRGIDDLGNMSAPLKYTWIVDLTAPSVVISAGPNALTNSAQANFQWTATDALSGIKTVECQLDGGAYAACGGGAISYPGLPAGSHTFTVRARDMAGNMVSASRNWVIDLSAPTVTITSGPNPYVQDLTSQFTFTGTDGSGIASYECKVNNNSYAACTSPFTSSNLNEGNHIFYVRAIDKAGNTSDPATRTWAIDLSPPIIRVVAAPVTIKAGDHAVIQYQVVDLASGVGSVKCGLTIPGPLGTCQPAATVDLGAISIPGNYTFQIQALDNVGNSMTENVNFTVTAVTIICDPFAVGNEGPCGGGLIGNIYYLNTTQQNSFKNLGTKTVDYFYTYGTKVEALLNLKQLFVSTRSFDTGFPASNGQLIKDNNNNTLYSYFAFRLNTVFKLDPLTDTPGWYQFATLSDDGSVVNITPQPASPAQLLINSDGDHSTRMGCAQQAVYIDDTTRLGMEIKYYQGPPTEIALVLMWKKVSGPNAALDSSCGVAGNNSFFGAPPYTDFTNSGYGALVNRGWRVVAPANFIAPATN